MSQFDFMANGLKYGVKSMSQQLLDRVRVEKPDLLFMVLFDQKHDPLQETVREITETTDTATLVWICDDHWKFADYSRHWAECLDWIVTTDHDAIPKYRDCGLGDRAILSQWAVNHRLYRPTHEVQDIDVSFVGQPHSNRVEIIDRLRRAGIDVKVFGFGWGDAGHRLPFHEMVRTFSRSRINLNMANALDGSSQQIKGRNFEVPGCKGFLLTDRVPQLDSYFEPDREIALFDDEDDLVRKVQFYLQHEEQRRRIATLGYARCLREHTWDHRFHQLFDQIGLWTGSAKRRTPAESVH